MGYVIAKGGFSDGEVEALRVFFERPEVLKELEGVVPRKVTKEEREKNLVNEEKVEKFRREGG